MRLIFLGAVALAYYGSARLALLWSAGTSGIVSIWLANAILLGALMLARPGRRVEILCVGAAASFLANLHDDMPLLVSAGFTLANVCEAGLALWLLDRCKIVGRNIVEARSMFWFIQIAILASGLSAAIASLVAIEWRPYFLWSWFSSDLVGILLVTPVLVLLPELIDRVRRKGTLYLVKFLAMLGLVAGATAITFMQSTYPLMFLPMIVLVPLSLRFGLVGASAGVLTIAIGSSLAASVKSGPLFLIGGDHGNVTLFLQFYFLVLWGASLPASAMIMARRRASLVLANTVAQLERAERCAHIGHWRVDVASQSLFWSAEVYRIHGLDPDMPPPALDDALDYYHPDDRDRVAQCVEVAMTTGEPFEFVARIVVPGQGETYLSSYGEAECDAEGNVVALFGMAHDITLQVRQHDLLVAAREKAEEATRIALKTADTDALTGIANRRAAERIGHRLVAAARTRGTAMSLAILDADHFKLVNDNFGHAVGDEVLRFIASTAQTGLRGDDLLARIGGEEFLLILPNTTDAIAARIIDRIRAAIEESGLTSDLPAVTISAGIAEWQAGDSFDDVLKRADNALYEAKEAGRNRYKIAA